MLFRKEDVAMVVNLVNGFHCLIPRMFGKPVASEPRARLCAATSAGARSGLALSQR